MDFSVYRLPFTVYRSLFLLYIKKMNDKNELRKKAREIRNSLDMQNISESIVRNILQLEEYQKATNVMIFYPLKHEVNLLGLMEDESAIQKTFYLPRVEYKNLIVCPYKIGDKLTVSQFMTKEPLTVPVDRKKMDIIFVPALMVDSNFNRLGYGGGFYDRFLSSRRARGTKIAAIPSALITDNLPSEAFDIKMDLIVCEELLRTLKSGN